MSYTQLTQEERCQIYALLKTGCSQTKIAETIKVHKSTISRAMKFAEIKASVDTALNKPITKR